MPNVYICDFQLFVLCLSVLKINNEPPSFYCSRFHHHHKQQQHQRHRHHHHHHHHELSFRPVPGRRIKTSTLFILFLMCPWHFINLRLILVERPWVLIRFSILFTILFIRGPGNVLGIAILRAGQSGNRI